MNLNGGTRRVGINGGGPRDTVFGRIRARGQRQRAGGGSTNGEARSTARRGMNDLMALG